MSSHNGRIARVSRHRNCHGPLIAVDLQDDGAEVHYEWHCPEAGWVRWACPEATEAREVRVSAPFPASAIRVADDLPVGQYL